MGFDGFAKQKKAKFYRRLHCSV